MLDISPVLLLFTMVFFLVILFILNKVVYKPILAFMDSRNEGIRKDQEEANKILADANGLEEEARQIILKAKNEASRLKHEVLQKAKEDTQSKLDVKKRQLDDDYQIFVNSLEEEKKEFKNNLLAQIPIYKQALKAKLSKI